MEVKVNSWVDIITYLLNNIDMAKKGHSGFFFDNVHLDQVSLSEDPFKTCCYTNINGKLSTLRKQYLNKESLDKVKDRDPSETVSVVSMVGGPKWGSTAGNKHCMELLKVDHQNKKVEICFRNSDFLKKFLVDLFFVRSILSEVGIEGYSFSCYFKNLTLRTPFLYLYLAQLPEELVRKFLESDNPLALEFIRYYRGVSKKAPTYKSLERSARYMKALPVYNIIKEYL